MGLTPEDHNLIVRVLPDQHQPREGYIDESDLSLWHKDSLLFDGPTILGLDHMEDNVVFRAHDGYYYMVVAAINGSYNFRDLFLLRGNDVRFTGLTLIGNILNHPLATWEDWIIRPRSIIHDREHQRYILYYQATGSVTETGIGILVSTYANFPAVWAEGASNPILSGTGATRVTAPMAFKRWGTYIVLCFRGNPWAPWWADSMYFDSFYVARNVLTTFGNMGNFRGALEVPNGWLMMHEAMPGGIWHNELAFIQTWQQRVMCHEDYATQFGPTEAYEGGAVANGFLYREPFSNRIWCYYGCWNAGGIFDRVALAYADLRTKRTFP
jgi:hypothetical protein